MSKVRINNNAHVVVTFVAKRKGSKMQNAKMQKCTMAQKCNVKQKVWWGGEGKQAVCVCVHDDAFYARRK